MKKERLWTRDYILLFIANFFAGTIFYALSAIIVAYAISDLGADTVTAGTVSSIYVVGILLGRLISGRYMEIVGRKKLATICMILFLVPVSAYLIATDINTMMIVRFLHGLIYGIAINVISTGAISLVPISRLGEGTGMFSLGAALATAIGPFIANYLMDTAGFHELMLLCIALAFSATIFVCIARFKELDFSPKQRKAMLRHRFRISDFIDIDAVPISITTIPVGICCASIFAYNNMYSATIGMESYSGLFFIVFAIALCVARPVNGMLLDRRGDNIVMYLFYSIYTVGFVMLAFAGASVFLFLAAAVPLALGYGSLQSAGNTIAVKLTHRAFMGRAISTFFMLYEIGFSLGPILLGALLPYLGYQTLYLLLACISGLSMLLYYILHGRKVPGIYEKNHDEYL